MYIVDCGATMSSQDHGRPKSNLDWALEYVWDKITSTVALGRKTTIAGVIGLRTDGSSNRLYTADEPDYAHITEFQDLLQIQMPQLRKLQQDLLVAKTRKGDAISALVVAIQMIGDTCRKLQYARKIVLVTDARGVMQADDLSSITAKIKDDGIELIILGVDFDDADYGFKEEAKDHRKAENEEILRTLCTDCGGVFGTLAQAVDELGVPRVKSTRPVATFKGVLTLGNPEEYDTALSIDVERYPKTMKASAPSASNFVLRNDMAAGEATQSQWTDGDDQVNGNNDGLASVKNARTYQVEDEEAPGGKRDVERDELAKGYEYGRTAVHISESDQNVTTYETTAGFDIVGFVDKNQYEHYMDMARTYLTVAAKGNEKAAMALSSFIHALYELESYAIARLVTKENRAPSLVLLAPNIEPDFECLYDVELPFAEDVRSYRFPPLDRVVTVSGKIITVHRNLPNDALQSAMDVYVDSMDLSTFGTDDDGQPAEYAAPDETYSIALHRVAQVIKHRAIYPEQPPPEPYDIVTQFSKPPPVLLSAAQASIDDLLRAADVKKVPPRARGRRSGKNKEPPKPLSDLDVGALLAQDPKRKRKRIDPPNAIAEFKQLMAAANSVSELQDACTQFQVIIFDSIRRSFGDANYGQAVESLRVMREECDELEEPAMWNEVLTELKAKVLREELGGDRTEFWFKLRQSKTGLIVKTEHVGGVEDKEAKSFWKLQ